MKRIWLFLLSMGLIISFSVTASAADIKVGADYFVAGIYLKETDVLGAEEFKFSPGTAFYYQRLRVGTDFIVSPGLKLVTRFDAMERIWGGARNESSSAAADSYGTRSENENIAFDWAYVNYVSPIGTFDVGLMNYGSTGTLFGNSSTPAGRIKYNYAKAPFTIGADYSKVSDNSYSADNTSAYWTDADKDVYGIEGTYKWKDGKAGMKINYYRYADAKPGKDYLRNYFLFTPYVFAKIGPVDLQAEFNYATGKYKKYDDGDGNLRMDQMSAFVDASANFAPFYAGASLAYISGDDPETDKVEGGTLTGGRDWNPCLIMFNTDIITDWVGGIYSDALNPSTGSFDKIGGPMSNAIFVQGRIGVKPTPQLDAVLSVSYATADEKPGYVNNKEYGWEIDVTGTYKITNNLSYMLGVGYLYTGDYYKGDKAGVDVDNDYLIINKLTLSF